MVQGDKPRVSMAKLVGKCLPRAGHPASWRRFPTIRRFEGVGQVYRAGAAPTMSAFLCCAGLLDSETPSKFHRHRSQHCRSVPCRSVPGTLRRVPCDGRSWSKDCPVIKADSEHERRRSATEHERGSPEPASRRIPCEQVGSDPSVQSMRSPSVRIAVHGANAHLSQPAA